MAGDGAGGQRAGEQHDQLAAGGQDGVDGHQDEDGDRPWSAIQLVTARSCPRQGARRDPERQVKLRRACALAAGPVGSTVALGVEACG